LQEAEAIADSLEHDFDGFGSCLHRRSGGSLGTRRVLAAWGSGRRVFKEIADRLITLNAPQNDSSKYTILKNVDSSYYSYGGAAPTPGLEELKTAEGYKLQPLTLFLLLGAFSNGCAALTGIEAISNGVPAFKKPEAKNAATTLVWMAILLTVMFLGTSVLAYLYGVHPHTSETVISQFARIVFTGPMAWFYYVVQIATALILVLAANTSFADFPRLSSLLARDRFLPRQFATRGDKLVFSNGIVILATGPLTSEALSASIREFAGENHLYFYDAISPIVDADSINLDRVYRASRYDKGDADYLNCPFTREEYLRFYDALVQAESVPLHECENAAYFEACLPIEEMAKRGVDTLRFGPMKPVGLKDPKTGRLPYAAIQLRQENLRADSYNLVGFQNHLRFGEQERIFRLIPGLENANFTRLGQIHRNTFINSPRLLLPTLQSRKDPRIFFAGQICGVEGYVECIATGLMAGINAVRLVSGQEPVTPPRETAIGSLLHYLGSAEPDRFQPENINFGIMPPPNLSAGEKRLGKREKHLLQTKYALQAMKEFADFLNPVSLPH